MVKKIFSHSLSGCMSCMGLCRVLLEIVRPTTCYRINPEFWELCIKQVLIGLSKCIHCGILKKEMWMHHIVFAPQDLQKHQRGLNFSVHDVGNLYRFYAIHFLDQNKIFSSKGNKSIPSSSGYFSLLRRCMTLIRLITLAFSDKNCHLLIMYGL